MTYKIKRFPSKGVDTNCLPDLLVVLAANIEEAYQTAGVINYTAKDCVDQAISLVTSKTMM